MLMAAPYELWLLVRVGSIDNTPDHGGRSW
jgi:hypothetical protein